MGYVKEPMEIEVAYYLELILTNFKLLLNLQHIF